MNLQAIQLRNFRGFASARIALKPLTVILGPNSSGKSAFGHALAALSHAQSQHSGGRASLTPKTLKDAEDWPIDLGQFKDLVTHGVEDRVYIDLFMREGQVDLGFGNVPDVAELLLSYIRHPVGMSSSVASQPTLPFPETASGARSEVGQARQLEAKDTRHELKRINANQWRDGDNLATAVGLSGLLLDTVRREMGTEFTMSGPARDGIRHLLENTTYLRATRKRPMRGYESRREALSANRIGYAGEFAASALLNPPGDENAVRLLKPPRVSPDSETRAILDAPFEESQESLAVAVSKWLQWLGLAQSVEARLSSRNAGMIETLVTMSGSGTRDITEVGFGVSQVLPVLVAGLLQPEDGLFVVDLPEAHLHPRPQAPLADFFCSLALMGKSALVETHSEMFFHQLRLRAATSTELREKIAVYFVDPPENGCCCQPREVGLDLQQEPEWPAGFLQESWETEVQIRLARQARKER